MNFTKTKSLIVASCLAIILTGCMGYNGTIEADKLNDEALKNSYRELSVVLDENEDQSPRYIMYASLTNFGLRGENTIKGLPPVVVKNQRDDTIYLNGKDIPVDLLNWIFWFLPSIPPVYAYYAQDTYIKTSNVSQINYQYSVKLRDSLPIVNQIFVEDPFQKISVNTASCSSTNTNCTITTNYKAVDNKYSYRLSFKPQNTSNTKCHLITSDITTQLQLSNTATIVDDRLKESSTCMYNVSVVANTKLTKNHDRLDFTYVTKILTTTVH